MRAAHVGWIVAWLIVGLVSPAAAQVVQIPPGSIRGLFGGSGPSSAPQGLSLTFDADGGYEDNSAPEVDGPAEQFGPIQSGYVTTAAAALRYQKGREARYVLATGAGSINTQQISSEGRSYRLIRGQGAFQAATGMGRRSGVSMALGVDYEPTYLFGAFSSLGRGAALETSPEDTPLPTEDPTLSLTEQRWLIARAGGSGFYNWTSRQRMSVGYEGSWVEPLNGTGLESRMQTTTVHHAWDRFATVGFDFTYRYDDNSQVFDGGSAVVLRLHTAEARLRSTRRLSPSRDVSVSLGGGAVQARSNRLVDSPDFDLFAPIVSGSIRFGFARTWGVSVSARRDVTIISGLSPVPFESQAALLSLDRTVARRLWLALSGGYSRGLSSFGRDGGYDLALVNAQVRYGFGPHAGLLVRYTYNRHELRDVFVASPSFPLQYSRNSIRVGVTVWLPLYGIF